MGGILANDNPAAINDLYEYHRELNPGVLVPVTLTTEPLHQKITPVQTSKVPFGTVSRASLRCECTALKGRIIFTSENLLWQVKTFEAIAEEGAAEGIPVFRRQLQRVVNNSVWYRQ